MPFGKLVCRVAASTLQTSISAVRTREGNATDTELGLPFKRVKNLVWIEENELYRAALEDWESQKKSLGAKLDRREKRSEELTNQIYNLDGFFSVFQGVILTAVTQLTQSTSASRPLCGKVWFPIVLAAIAAVFGIGLKFSQLHSIDRLIHADRLEQREAEKREAKLLREGESFHFKSLKDQTKRPLRGDRS